MNTPGHLSPGMWKHPRNGTSHYNKLSFWTNLAKTLDDAGFHAMFIADTLGPYDVYKGPANVDPCLTAGAQFPVNDPLFLVPAMATVTKNLIFESAARSFGLDTQIEHDERYKIADEYMEVLYKLWEGSWKDNAATRNLQTGHFAEPGLVRPINHKGQYFKVAGPHICEPSPQRTPLLFQAGISKAGVPFGGKHAEAIFIGG
ncbi:Putative Luciferase-like domain-containing protein [Septoria linicola]|uniref:Luciferase-like domain-containing protein n=1 Tax=Septoria linicola TaxID=215465 RepID=A0A9Q9B1J1_9PEZI|nr:Putative Luciferase-like domain-containing protein [Septoria linicola]